MKIGEIYEILDAISPFCTQEAWDNSGLLIGDFECEVERIYLTLDVDSEFLADVKPNSLIIAHHPLIFKGLKSLNFSTYPSSLAAEMVRKNISLIAMHTNYDKSHLNEYVLREILGFCISSRDEFLLYTDVNFSFDELCKFIKQKFELENLRVVKASDKTIKKLAFCTGSGGDLVEQVRADVFLSGDIKYHQALSAKENGLNIIDIGHFESERYFGESLAKNLQNFAIPIIIRNLSNPFTQI